MELIVSDFMTSTCAVNPQPNINRIYALYYVINEMHMPVRDGDYTRIAMSSGSTSEFYIEPMLPCVNDIDIMSHRNDRLAIPAGHPVPLSLPSEFHREVTVFEFEDTPFPFPCFVFARCCYKLVKCDNSHSYTRTEVDVTDSGGFLHGTRTQSGTYHGPAAVSKDIVFFDYNFRVTDHEFARATLDNVYCVRCPVWPPQAAEWPTRRRQHGWPDSATIDCLVNNGCDVVQVAHPHCEFWISVYQWRLSFSRAETVLLNSWSPKQQLVYHMLRVVTTIIQSNYENTVIRRYYLKTLMLWACELHSEDWWNVRCVVSICTELLYELADCLKAGELPMYFVSKCNLFDKVRDLISEQVVRDLLALNDERLSWRFVKSYVRQCGERVTPAISCVLNDLNTLSYWQEVLSVICYRRFTDYDGRCWTNFGQAIYVLQQLVYDRTLTANSCNLVIEQLQTIDRRLIDFFSSLIYLNALSNLERGSSIIRVAEAVLTVVLLRGQGNAGSASKYTTCTVADSLTITDCITLTKTKLQLSYEYFYLVSRLLRLARRTHSESKPTIALLDELSKTCLLGLFKCAVCNPRCENEQVKRLSSVYLACLYCSSGQYRAPAAVFCDVAMTTKQKISCSSCRIERELLPPFDTNVDNVFGVVLLYQFLVGSTLNKLQVACVDNFSPDLFTRYLTMLCCPFADVRDRLKYEFRWHCFYCEDLTMADILLCYFHHIKNKSMNKLQLYSTVNADETIVAPASNSSNFDASFLRQSLLNSAVECLNSFQLVVSRDFSSVRTIVSSDYEAMYAYKLGLYEKCLNLSYINVDTLLSVPRQQQAAFITIPKSDLLLHLVDDDILSLIGLARLCGAFDVEYPKIVEHLLQPVLSLFLLLQCKLKLRHCPPTFVETLRNVKLEHELNKMATNRSMMIYIYRKALLRLRCKTSLSQRNVYRPYACQ